MGEAISGALEQGDNRVDTIDSRGKVVVYVGRCVVTYILQITEL